MGGTLSFNVNHPILQERTVLTVGTYLTILLNYLIASYMLPVNGEMPVLLGKIYTVNCG